MAHSMPDASLGPAPSHCAGRSDRGGGEPTPEVTKAADTAKVIEATRVVVFPDRLEVTVRVKDESCRYASRSLVAACLRSFPELPFHACKNDKGPLFGDVLDQASLPHLLEHLVITLQVRDDQEKGANNFSYLGATQWIPADRSAGAGSSCCAKVSVRFRNDVVALTCLNKALAFVNGHF